MIELSGDWHSYYRYSSSTRGGEDFWGQDVLHATQDGNKLKLENDPESASRLKLELELSTDGRTAQGTWHEQTDPDGDFKGAEYEGTIELHVVENGARMNGIWRGLGQSGKMHSDIWELTKGLGVSRYDELPKQWKLTHWYPSNKHEADAFDEHEMKGYWDGNTLVLESLPKDNGSYMLARLHLQDDIATGNWYESASLTGEYEGAQYSGAGQLVINPETYRMEGKWAGAGYDHELKKMQIYTGKWEIVPTGLSSKA